MLFILTLDAVYGIVSSDLPGYSIGKIIVYFFLDHNDYLFPATVPLESETHGGDDVGIFAIGPFADYFAGVVEQNVIPHIMAYASCVGDGATICNEVSEKTINEFKSVVKV